MGKPKPINSKRKKDSDSASDTSFSTPKRGCSEQRSEQRRITEYATSSMTESSVSNEKLDQILEEVAQLQSVPKLIGELKNTLEQLRGELFDLSKKCGHLERDLELEKKKNATLEQQAKEAKYQATLALAKADDIEQYNRRSNIRIINLPDSSQHESHHECLRKVTHYLAYALNVPTFSEEHIDICHRVGRYTPDGPPRQVIVRFMRRSTTLDVMGQRRRLPKGDPFVVEDLTKQRLQLLHKARAFPGARNAWARNGSIYARLWGDRVVHITEETDWDRLHDQAMLSPEHRGENGNATPSRQIKYAARNKKTYPESNRTESQSDPIPALSRPIQSRGRGSARADKPPVTKAPQEYQSPHRRWSMFCPVSPSRAAGQSYETASGRSKHISRPRTGGVRSNEDDLHTSHRSESSTLQTVEEPTPCTKTPEENEEPCGSEAPSVARGGETAAYCLGHAGRDTPGNGSIDNTPRHDEKRPTERQGTTQTGCVSCSFAEATSVVKEPIPME